MAEIEDIDIKVNRFYSLIKDYKEGAPETRYKSWEWCHDAFVEKKEEYRKAQNEKVKEEIVDFLSLHLAFYLASWGMYRGSSYLLKRDYKAHKKAVKKILDKKYEDLWGFELKDKTSIDNAKKLLFNKEGDKRGIYWVVKESYNIEQSNEDDEASDTLTTKILMGTFGCVPAFDRYLKAGISAYKKVNTDSKYKFTQQIEDEDAKTFEEIAKFVIGNKDKLNKIKKVSALEKYPLMKLVDMYFWEIGYELDIAKGLVSPSNSETTKNRLLKKAQSLLKELKGKSFEEVSQQLYERNGVEVGVN